MENALSDMKIKSELSERRNAELKACEEKRHAEEVAFLKNTNAQLNVSKILLGVVTITIYFISLDYLLPY